MSEIDEMTQAHTEQLSDDLAKKAEAASAAFVWDEGYYLAQYKKSTAFASEKEEFTRKDGTGTFKNVMYGVPVWAMVFDLLGFSGRKNTPIEHWDKPKGFSFKACFREVANDYGIVRESINGGLMQACASSNGFTGRTTDELLNWYQNHMVVIHIGKMKATEKQDARNLVRSIKPYNG